MKSAWRVAAQKPVEALVRLALLEDRAADDITSRSVLHAATQVSARIIARAPGVLAGGHLAASVFRAVDHALRCQLLAREGARLRPGQPVLTMRGRAQAIFAAERTALNFLGHLSGIATLTAAYVRAVQGTRAAILDTRKTLPGLRLLEKYAVRMGGGHNHRPNLAEAILIKTNHLKVLGQETGDGRRAIQRAIKQAKRRFPSRFVEVEVTTLNQFQTALAAKPHAILLDNMSLRDVRRAVHLSHVSPPMSHMRRPLLEVSGGITLANVRAYARAGVDRIAIGRLTHSAPALDFALRVA